MIASCETGTAAPPLSMVVTTLGRVDAVERLFDSLVLQHFGDFDVTVIDQNDDDRLAPLLARAWPFPVRRLHTPGERGASRGRNRGWRACRGGIVLFPDDDCWYPADFLDRSLRILRDRQCDVLAGRAADETGRNINGRFETVAQRIDMVNAWTTAIEWMVFFHRGALEAVDGFDEAVGVGASTPWQSSEIQEILIRQMAAGLDCWYDPAIIGHHEEIVLGTPDARVLRKARGYARGMGFVLQLHGYGVLAIAGWVARPLARGALEALRGRWGILPYQGQVALGRLEGALRRPLDRSR